MYLFVEILIITEVNGYVAEILAVLNFWEKVCFSLRIRFLLH